MGNSEKRGTLRVLITSVDGRVDHPFRPEETVGDVRQWGYEKLVRDTQQVQFNATWIEHGGQRVDDARALSSFDLPDERQPGREIDLTLNLAWTTQGGSFRGW